MQRWENWTDQWKTDTCREVAGTAGVCQLKLLFKLFGLLLQKGGIIGKREEQTCYLDEWRSLWRDVWFRWKQIDCLNEEAQTDSRLDWICLRAKILAFLSNPPPRILLLHPKLPSSQYRRPSFGRRSSPDERFINWKQKWKLKDSNCK